MRNRKLRILILATFLIALLLSLSSYWILNFSKAENGGDEQIELPITEIKWPKISENKLARSINTYEGDVDIYEMKDIFEDEFYEDITSEQKKWISVEYFIKNGEAYAVADCNLDEIDGKLVTNPTHTYKYKLKVNE